MDIIWDLQIQAAGGLHCIHIHVCDSLYRGYYHQLKQMQNLQGLRVQAKPLFCTWFVQVGLLMLLVFSPISCWQRRCQRLYVLPMVHLFYTTALNVTKPPIAAGWKVYWCLGPRCGTDNSYRPLHQPSPIFHRGSQSTDFCLVFQPHSPSERCDLKTEQKFKNLKQYCIASMSGLSSAADPVQQGPPTLTFICPIGAPKARQLEKRLHHSNSATRGRIAFKFYKMVLCGSVRGAIVKTHFGSNPGWRTMPKF